MSGRGINDKRVLYLVSRLRRARTARGSGGKNDEHPARDAGLLLQGKVFDVSTLLNLLYASRRRRRRPLPSLCHRVMPPHPPMLQVVGQEPAGRAGLASAVGLGTGQGSRSTPPGHWAGRRRGRGCRRRLVTGRCVGGDGPLRVRPSIFRTRDSKAGHFCMTRPRASQRLPRPCLPCRSNRRWSP